MKNLVPLPGVPHYTIAVLKPQSFDEATQAVDALKAGTVILLNLASLGAEKAQRFADFAAGSACALSGHQTVLGHHIFLFAPPMVEIVTQLKTA